MVQSPFLLEIKFCRRRIKIPEEMILWCVEADEKTWRISWFWNILTYSYDILPWFYDVVHSYSKDRLSKGWRSMWRELRLSRVMSNIWHKYMVQKCFRFWGVGARPAISIYLTHLENIAGRAPPLLKIWNILTIKQLAKTMNLALYVFFFLFHKIIFLVQYFVQN